MCPIAKVKVVTAAPVKDMFRLIIFYIYENYASLGFVSNESNLTIIQNKSESKCSTTTEAKLLRAKLVCDEKSCCLYVEIKGWFLWSCHSL